MKGCNNDLAMADDVVDANAQAAVLALHHDGHLRIIGRAMLWPLAHEFFKMDHREDGVANRHHSTPANGLDLHSVDADNFLDVLEGNYELLGASHDH